MAKKTTRGKRGLGTIYKRGTDGKEYPANSKVQGNFWLQWRKDGKRTRIRLEVDGEPVTDIKTAEKEQFRLRAPFITGNKLDGLRKMKADISELEEQQSEEIDQANPPLTIEGAWDAYLKSASRPNSGPGTLNNYLGHWNAFRSWMEGQSKGYTYLSEITEDDSGAFMAYLRDTRKVSGNTYNKYLQFLKTFCKVLMRHARLESNPFDGIKRLSQIPNSRRELTIEELYKIISSAKGDLKLLLLLGTCTGLRLGDCCTLLWEEIDLEKGIIRRIPRKTQRSKKSVVIGIPNILHQLLVTIPENQRNGTVLPRLANIYINRNEQNKISNMIQAHFRSCGIDTHEPETGSQYHYEGRQKVYEKRPRAIVSVGFHSLRHTWVSIHAMSGTPQAIIQNSVGHSNPAMTAHYTHTSADAARRISSVFDSPQFTDITDVEIVNEEEQVSQAEDRQHLHALVEKLPNEDIQKLMNLLDKEKIKSASN